MSDINRSIIAGRFTRNPELSKANNGNSVMNFTIANNRKYKQGSELKSEASFIPCTAWGKLAETIYNHFKKGDKIIVSGRTVQRSYNDMNGAKISIMYIRVEDFDFGLGKKHDLVYDEDTVPFGDTIPHSNMNGEG